MATSEGSGSPPVSLCMIRASELFPKPPMEKDDLQLTVPFQELAGESVKYLGRTDDGVLALSNYRIFLQKNSTNFETSIPLGLIESLQARDLFHLIIYCKDVSTVKCSFETAEQCTEWQRRLQMSIGVPETLESIFAFPFCSWSCDIYNNGGSGSGSKCGSANGYNDSGPIFLYQINNNDNAERFQRSPSRYEDDFMREVERLGFDLNSSWRISNANDDFKLCPSYPKKILVPCCISDETLNNVANFRGSRRLPAVVWRHRKSGAVIARCSQPEVGWLGWRNTKDEQLLKALADACAFDRGEQMRALNHGQTSMQNINAASAISTSNTTLHRGNTASPLTLIPSVTSSMPVVATSGDSSPASADGSHEEVPLDEVRKILIVDARSYTSAVTNRARGGGCECIEYYPCAEIEFMNLGNIHVIRKSFHALRQLCASPPDVPNWLGLLEKTMWLQHLSGLLAASMTVCHAIDKKGRPVLVHCSDGWDRTPQIVATAQLCLDPYYRTVDGFRVLVEREWLSYGHKFADRCGHGPGSDELNERCPVFLQWLDLVHQIHKQFPCSFEFSMGYLIKLAQHSHSGLFGTFLCNTLKERLENCVFERTFSVWPFLSGPMYRNPLYMANKSEKVLWPVYNVRDLSLWTEVYLGSLGGTQTSSIDIPGYALNDSVAETAVIGNNPMAKTRSYGDLITAGFIQNGISRRSSDPNMIVDPILSIDSNSESNSIADFQLDEHEEKHPDILANLIHDTTRQLENLTIELNNHDDDDFGIQLATTTKENFGNNKTMSTHNTSGCDLINNDNSIESTAAAAVSHHTHENNNHNDDYIDIICEEQKEQQQQNGFSYNDDDNYLIRRCSTINVIMDKSIDMEQCLDGVDSPVKSSIFCNGYARDDAQNMWHGSVNTSTDTLVPVTNTDVKQQQHQQQQQQTNIKHFIDMKEMNRMKQPEQINERLENTQELEIKCNDADSIGSKEKLYNLNVNVNNNSATTSITSTSSSTIIFNNSNNNNNNSNNSKILPKVHSTNVTRPQQQPLQQSQRLNVNQVIAITNPSSLSSYTSSLKSIPTTTTCEIAVNNYINNFSQLKSHKDNNAALNNDCNVVKTAITEADVDRDVGDNVPALIMEESIFILPEHEKLEMSFSGKCETISKTPYANTVTTTGNTNPFITSNTNVNNNIAAPAVASTSSASALGSSSSATSMNLFNMPYGSFLANSTNTIATASTSSVSVTTTSTTTTTTATTRRRRTSSSSNSKRDGFIAKNLNGSYLSRFSLPSGSGVGVGAGAGSVGGYIGANGNGVRSLPMTPPGLMERPPITISCPDGLAHALSEENIRLQQIVHEHKLREDVLLREIHDMRMALLKKICPNCNNPTASTTGTTNINDDQCTALDNIENASICSWEAVEDRSVTGPFTFNTSSSMQSNPSSVLWVPDHAVSRCTSCQTEFWLGRRKHHCRSCGQIFCADCSEFWAALPDAKLFSPVRLCGPCYHTVTTRGVQQQHHQQQQQQQTQEQEHQQQQQQNQNRFNSINALTEVAAGNNISQQQQQQQSKNILSNVGLSGGGFNVIRGVVSDVVGRVGGGSGSGGGGSGGFGLHLQQHQQQNQCAAASMKANNANSNAASAAATTTATN